MSGLVDGAANASQRASLAAVGALHTGSNVLHEWWAGVDLLEVTLHRRWGRFVGGDAATILAHLDSPEG